jgi:two-component system chemotaxis response regulator CheB
MADRLDGVCGLQVQEVRDGVRPRAGQVWVAPGDHHVVARKERGDLRLRLDDSLPVNSCRPSVDVLLESLAAGFGRETLAVMLTGMGSDGLNGCARIGAAGGRVIAQDRESSVVWGMPGAVVEAGLADNVFPLEEMAGEISRMVGRSRCRAGTNPPRPPAGGSRG